MVLHYLKIVIKQHQINNILNSSRTTTTTIMIMGIMEVTITQIMMKTTIQSNKLILTTIIMMPIKQALNNKTHNGILNNNIQLLMINILINKLIMILSRLLFNNHSSNCRTTEEISLMEDLTLITMMENSIKQMDRNSVEGLTFHD